VDGGLLGAGAATVDVRVERDEVGLVVAVRALVGCDEPAAAGQGDVAVVGGLVLVGPGQVGLLVRLLLGEVVGQALAPRLLGGRRPVGGGAAVARPASTPVSSTSASRSSDSRESENDSTPSSSPGVSSPAEDRSSGSVTASDQQLEADDVLVADAQEHLVAGPEDGPAVLLVDLARVDVALVLELVAARMKPVLRP
jgi:hypothetical protein